MSSILQSLWYQIFEVAFFFLGRYFPQSFPVTGLSPRFFSRKGNRCPVIAQKPQTTSPAQSPPPAAARPGEKPAKTGSAVAQQFMNLLLAYFFSRLGKDGKARSLMSPPELCDLPAALASGEEQQQEESVGVLAHEWAWSCF